MGISVSCIVNIASLAIGVVAHIVVWKTGFFDKIEEEEKNKVSEEPKEKLGKKQPSMYDQYDNDDLYEQDKPEKKIDTQKKSDTCMRRITPKRTMPRFMIHKNLQK